MIDVTAHTGTQVSGDDARNNVFAGEDTGTPGIRARVARHLRNTDRDCLNAHTFGVRYLDRPLLG